MRDSTCGGAADAQRKGDTWGSKQRVWHLIRRSSSPSDVGRRRGNRTPFMYPAASRGDGSCIFGLAVLQNRKDEHRKIVMHIIDTGQFFLCRYPGTRAAKAAGAAAKPRAKTKSGARARRWSCTGLSGAT